MCGALALRQPLRTRQLKTTIVARVTAGAARSLLGTFAMRGPGLKKVRRAALVTTGERVRADDHAWRELFDHADAVSEGGVRSERAGTMWYGSTSLILDVPGTTDEERAFLAAVAERDVHVRLRAVRTARREASMRAPGTLGRTHCEIRVGPDPRGVRIDVDVQAPLIAGGVGAERGRT